MSIHPEARRDNARFTYFLYVVTIIAFNGVVVYLPESDIPVFLFVLLGTNILVFGSRTAFVVRYRRILFADKSYRRFEAATVAERVSFYALLLVIIAGLIASNVESLEISGVPLNIDDGDPLGTVGTTIISLALVTPVVTYLSSGYGKLRDIVQKSETRPVKSKQQAKKTKLVSFQERWAVAQGSTDNSRYTRRFGKRSKRKP